MGANCSTAASDCRVDFNDQAVVAYGNVTFGEFEANPDIAGIGVRASLLIQLVSISLTSYI